MVFIKVSQVPPCFGLGLPALSEGFLLLVPAAPSCANGPEPRTFVSGKKTWLCPSTICRVIYIMSFKFTSFAGKYLGYRPISGPVPLEPTLGVNVYQELEHVQRVQWIRREPPRNECQWQPGDLTNE